MKLTISLVGTAALLCVSVTSAMAVMAVVKEPSPAANMNVVAGPDAVKWGPGSPALPPGAQMAVMAGDPMSTGFISIRAKFPAGYTVPPHSHPTDEHVTVLSGSMAFGMGDTMDAKGETAVAAGGYFVAPQGMHHYAHATSAAEIQIDMMGPFGITYVNPADDPRNAKK